MDEQLTKELPAIGATVKIFLKGESPWGTVVDTAGDKIKVRIDSKLFNEYSEDEQDEFINREFMVRDKLTNKHGKKKGDEVWCRRDGVYDVWVENKNDG